MKEHSGTGSSPSEWPFYEACASFMDAIPLNNHGTVDSLEDTQPENDVQPLGDTPVIPTSTTGKKRKCIDPRPSTSGSSSQQSEEDDEDEESHREKVPGFTEEDALEAKLNPKRKIIPTP